jgi:GntR family transcriptional regulator
MSERTGRLALGDGRPLYDKVYRTLRSEIETGSLQPGDHLPSERTIAEQLAVSRITVRRALRELATEGLIEGRRVASLGEPPNALLSFTAMAAERGLAATSRVLSALVRGATLDEADLLLVAPGAPIFELRRVRFLGDVPIALDETRLAHHRVPGIEVVDFATASLYATLEARFGIVATRVDYSIEAAGATVAEAALLDVTVGASLLHAAETMYDQHDRPTDIGRIVYRGDRYRFRTTLLRRPVG